MGGSGLVASGGSGDAVAIGVTVLATLIVAGLLVAAGALVVSARRLRRQTDELAGQARSLLAELDGTVAHAAGELERVDDLIGSAERLTAAVGSASGFTRTAWASPVIKVMALGAGTARASERLRHRRRVRER